MPPTLASTLASPLVWDAAGVRHHGDLGATAADRIADRGDGAADHILRGLRRLRLLCLRGADSCRQCYQAQQH